MFAASCTRLMQRLAAGLRLASHTACFIAGTPGLWLTLSPSRLNRFVNKFDVAYVGNPPSQRLAKRVFGGRGVLGPGTLSLGRLTARPELRLEMTAQGFFFPSSL